MEKSNKARVISVLNFKGGVGKTTTALNLSAALARRGKKVLLIDLDVQMNSSFVLDYGVNDGDSIYELMMQEEVLSSLADFPIYDTIQDGLQFIPASPKLDTLIVFLTNMEAREMELKRHIEPLMSVYDYIIIDCPPAKSVLIDNALCASHSIIIPVTCEELSKQGLVTIITKYTRINNRLNPDLKILGFLLVKYEQRNKDSRDMTQLLADMGMPVLETKIRKCVSLNRCNTQYQNVFNYDEQTFKPAFGRKTLEYSNGAKDYFALADELIGMFNQ